MPDTNPPLINTKAAAMDILLKLRARLVGFMNEVSRKRWRPSEKAMHLAAYQQEIEALTLAIMALEQQKDAPNGQQPTA